MLALGGSSQAPARPLAEWPRRTAVAARRRMREGARSPVVIALGAILLAGLLLRVFLSRQWSPGFIGFPDSSIYIRSAHTGLFQNPLRVDGYGEFLRLMHGIRPHLAFAIRVQHVLGLLSGVLLFGAVRRAGLPSGLGLVPAAVVILGGSELLVEHAALTEAVFIFLVDLAIYTFVRAWQGRPWWAPATGAALGAAADVRSVGLVLLAAMAVMGAAMLGELWRGRLLRLALMLLAAAAPISWYLVAHRQADGYGGFTGSGYFDLYSRVAPFADCSKFKPPAGTANLCIHVPPSQRPGHDAWEFTSISPAVRIYGEPDETVPAHDENSRLRAFAEAAILGQPLTYLEYVGRDLVRVVDPSFPSSPYGNKGVTGFAYGDTPAVLDSYYTNPTSELNTALVMAGYYTDGAVHRNISFFLSYERDTRVEGPLMAVLLALALLAPILATGRRRAAFVFVVPAVVLLLAPILLSEYDYRFTIPAFGPLAAGAAVGAWGLYRRVAPRLAAGSGRRTGQGGTARGDAASEPG